MNISESFKDGVYTVKPDARLDSTTSPELNGLLETKITDAVTALVVDLSLVDYISSAGLRVFVAAKHLLKARPIILKNANISIKDILKMSGLIKLFTVE